MLRWIVRNITALVLALSLAVTVWIVALNEEDPFEEKLFPEPLPVAIHNLPEGMVLVANNSPTVEVRLRAPASVWASLRPDQVRVVADLSSAASGVTTVALKVEVDTRNARVVSVQPAEVQIALESIVTRTVPVQLTLTGDPAVGYQADAATLEPMAAVVSGPASAADSVSELSALVDLNGIKQTISQTVPLVPLNSSGQAVSGVTVEPASVYIEIPVKQLGGYRDVAVKALIEGQVAAGYRLTNIVVSPPVVTLFSSDPTLVAGIAGFVETETLDINQAKDDIEARVALNLPPNVSLVGNQTVVVQVSIAAIESSITVKPTLEIVGLPSNMSAIPSPTTVDVILSGPLPILDALTPDAVRVLLDLSGRAPGLHQVQPEVIVLPEGLSVQTVLPSTIEVIISRGTPTPTRTP